MSGPGDRLSLLPASVAHASFPTTGEVVTPTIFVADGSWHPTYQGCVTKEMPIATLNGPLEGTATVRPTLTVSSPSGAVAGPADLAALFHWIFSPARKAPCARQLRSSGAK